MDYEDLKNSALYKNPKDVADVLLSPPLPLQMKRGHLYFYLEAEGVAEDASDAERKGALEKLIYSLPTKRQQADLVMVINDILNNPFIH